ncbi:MAG: hypothetical protein Q4B99_05300 [Clostridia bacterium]|nr:hypothetical protein [Clostridia bacterium]
MKRFTALILTALVAVLCVACQVQPTQIDNPELTDVPDSTDAAVTPEGTVTPSNTPTGTPEAEVTAAVAYLLDDGATLYGAIEYENTGSVDIVLSEAAFVFSGGGSQYTCTFVPMLNQYDVLQPGMTSYVTYWGAAPDDGTFAVGQELALAATVTPAAAEAPRFDLGMSDIRILSNYPQFATVSGLISNAQEASCTMNMQYVAFYDADDALLGVWHFSENATMNPGDVRSFVVNMTELTIDGLAENTARIRYSSFGFDL